MKTVSFTCNGLFGLQLNLQLYISFAGICLRAVHRKYKLCLNTQVTGGSSLADGRCCQSCGLFNWSYIPPFIYLFVYLFIQHCSTMQQNNQTREDREGKGSQDCKYCLNLPWEGMMPSKSTPVLEKILYKAINQQRILTFLEECRIVRECTKNNFPIRESYAFLCKVIIPH